MTAIHCGCKVALAVWALCAAACQREAPLANADTVPDAPLPIPLPGVTSTPETESSLAIKRGTVTLSSEARDLRFCGQLENVWLVQQDDLILDETYARLAGEPGTPLYVELRGERVAAPVGTSIPASYSQAFLLEELLYASVPGEGGGCAAAAPRFRVMARGNEPFWMVEVTADRLLLRQPAQAEPLEFSQSETQDAEGTVTFKGASGKQALELTIANAACSDSMSGEYFAYTAEVRLDGQAQRGCARLGE